MAELFKFFNSAPGDERWHYASDFADYFGSVLSSGLISNKNTPVGLQVKINRGTLTTEVATGKAIIKGYSYENTLPLTLTHRIAEQTMDRIDRIVLRLDLTNASRFIKLFVIEGTASTNPVPPQLTRTNYIYEISLAQIRVRKNSATLVETDISDERADENLCGIVQSLITVPTSVFQQQFTQWFNSIAEPTEQEVKDWQKTQEKTFTEWFDTIKGQLDGDIGTKLSVELNEHKADLSHVHWLGKTTGNNVLSVSYSGIKSLTEGLGVAFVSSTSYNGATYLNINNLGNVLIKKANGSNAKLVTNGIYTLRYSNGNFYLQGEGGEYGTATASDVLVGKTFGTENGVIPGTMKNNGVFNLGLNETVNAGYYSGGKTANGRKTASGTLTVGDNSTIRVSGFDFVPIYVFVYTDSTNPIPFGIYVLGASTTQHNYLFGVQNEKGNISTAVGYGFFDFTYRGDYNQASNVKWIAIG